ncbi:MAG TPA: hypothetical protein VHB21_24125, partial [Minicystis sp.]|nr:hypothetical protein [Minicystis sp.]
LGRTLVADAWNDVRRLRATLAAWQRAGVSSDAASPLSRLERLVRVRVEPGLVEGLAPTDARAPAEEARAVGDEELAAELDARSRAAAYR